MDESKQTHEVATAAVVPPTTQAEGMSRGQQTAIITAVIISVALVMIYVMTRLPSSDPRAACQTMFGFNNECLVWGPDGSPYK